MRKQQYELYKKANDRIASNIQRLIKKAKWTVEKLAVESDLDKSNLYNMMNGKINFTMRALVKIETALETDISELFRKNL